eukprot:1701565-Rhodomonas_salina.1
MAHTFHTGRASSHTSTTGPGSGGAGAGAGAGAGGSGFGGGQKTSITTAGRYLAIRAICHVREWWYQLVLEVLTQRMVEAAGTEVGMVVPAGDEDYYDILKVARDATPAQVSRSRSRSRSRKDEEVEE